MDDSAADRVIVDAHRLGGLIAETTTSATSDDHTVTVTVAPGHAVTSIELSHQARRHSGQRLAELILEAIQTAYESLDDELTAAARELGPAASQAVASILGSPTATVAASAIADPPGLDELAAGGDRADRTGGTDGADGVDGWDDFTAEEWEFIRQSGVETELRAAQDGLAALQAQVEQQLAAQAEAQAQLSGRSVTASTPDGAIEVSVQDGVGVTRIDISDEVLRHGPSRVGPMVLTTIRQASAELAMTMAGLAAGQAGPLMNVREVVERYQPDDDS